MLKQDPKYLFLRDMSGNFHQTWEQQFKRFWIIVFINVFPFFDLFLEELELFLQRFRGGESLALGETTCSEKHILRLLIITKMNKGGVEPTKQTNKKHHFSLPSLIGSDQRGNFRTSSREFILENLASWMFLKRGLKRYLVAVLNETYLKA